MDLWKALERLPLVGRMVVKYSPRPQQRPFVGSALRAELENVTVTISALNARQSREFFGVPMARRGVQPLWLRIENRGSTRCRLHLISIDPNYYSPHEAAAVNHYS